MGSTLWLLQYILYSISFCFNIQRTYSLNRLAISEFLFSVDKITYRNKISSPFHPTFIRENSCNVDFEREKYKLTYMVRILKDSKVGRHG